MGGGVGSGLGALITHEIREDNPKLCIQNNVLYPSVNQCSTESIVASYNTVLSATRLHNDSDLTLIHSNGGLEQYCNVNLRLKSPTFKDFNQVIARAHCHYLRLFDGSPPLDFSSSKMTDFASSMIPYPRLNMLLPSFVQDERKKSMFS
jgi:hypothetical protein